MSAEKFTLVAAVNDDRVLAQNLLRSPALSDMADWELITRRGYCSAAHAYNSALDEATHDVVIFVHQDIYLPGTWPGDLRRALAYLRGRRENWGVLGCFGSSRTMKGGLGKVYTNGLGLHGNVIDRPTGAETLDEIVLVVRKSSRLRFDERMPHFHLYGTDICLAARKQGLNCFAFQGFCVHNTNQLLELPNEFYACYRYIKRKWRHELPIYSSCIKVSRFDEDLMARWLKATADRALGHRRIPQRRVEDPTVFMPELVGWRARSAH